MGGISRRGADHTRRETGRGGRSIKKEKPQSDGERVVRQQEKELRCHTKERRKKLLRDQSLEDVDSTKCIKKEKIKGISQDVDELAEEGSILGPRMNKRVLALNIGIRRDHLI